MTRVGRNGRRREGGFTLVVSALILVALLGLGLSAVWMASSNIGVARNLSGRQAAINAAQAGIQHARAILVNMGANPNDWTPALRGNQAQAALNDPLALNSYSHKGNILYDGLQPLVTLPFRVDPNAAQPLGMYTVWIQNDPYEARAATTTTALETETNGSVVIRSLGQDPTGQFQVVLKAAILQCVSVGGALNPGLGQVFLDFNNSSHTTVNIPTH